MAVTTTARVLDRQELDAMVDELLADLPPDRTEPEVFWGEQFDRGLALVHFPVGRGGLGSAPGLQGPVQRRILKAGASRPGSRNIIGYGMVAPTLVAHGTDEQNDRYLRAIFTCEEIWCQLFSEPGAGSDVASLATRAERDGDEWLLNGQKVWTTVAHLARARSPAGPDERGPAQAPGHHLLPRRHGSAGSGGATALPDHGRGRV